MILRYTILITVLWVQCAFGQATFYFQNFYPGEIDAPVFDAAGNRLQGDHYVAVLYGGRTPDALSIAQAGAGDMPPESFTAAFNGQPGYFYRSPRLIVRDTVGFHAWLQVRAWDTRLGASYDEVAALGLGGYGQSSLFYTYGGDIEATGIPPQPLRGLQSFSLVPEPSTWVLLALGSGILFWKCHSFRRPTRI